MNGNLLPETLAFPYKNARLETGGAQLATQEFQEKLKICKMHKHMPIYQVTQVHETAPIYSLIGAFHKGR